MMGPNKDINKDHKKLPVIQPELGNAEVAVSKMVKNTDKLIKDRLAAQHKQTILLPNNQKNACRKHNDERLAITILIVEVGMIAYHFW